MTRRVAVYLAGLTAGILGAAVSAQAVCTDPVPNNDCSPGGGSTKTDCQMEWLFTPVPKKLVNGVPVPDEFRGRPRNRIICYEGDPRCDFDADLNNHSCTFRAAIVINNEDPNLPKCSIAAGVATFEVTRPKDSPFSIDSTDLINLATLETQFNADFGVPVVRNGALLHLGATSVTPNQAGTPMDLIVQQRVNGRGIHKTGTRRIRVRSANIFNQRDQDSLLLMCRPSTCGDGFLDSDHELCDDGNRTNNDGCNQGCQPDSALPSTPTPTLTSTPTSTGTSPPGAPTNTPGAATATATITATPAGPPTAFRGATLSIMDPHIFVAPSGTCTDFTTLVNLLVSQNLGNDLSDPPDGLLDLSVLLVFRPLAQASPGGSLDVMFGADCTAPVAGTSCSPGDATVQPIGYANQTSGTCLMPIAGTTGGFSPAITNTTAPCFVSDQIDISFDLSGLTIPLEAGQFAATYVGTPATSLSSGLIIGFLGETAAEGVFLPASLPAPFGGAQLSSLLPGGANNCKTVPPRGPCTTACRDDRDMGPGGEMGWYFYLNYTGPKVPYTEP